jgi:spore germination protein KC
MMKKMTVTILCILISFSVTGCWSSSELNDYAFVMGVAVDEGSDQHPISMTVQIAKASGYKATITGGGDSEDSYWNVSKEGETIFSTVRSFTHESGRKLNFQHNDVVIYGHSIAEEGLQNYINFFTRDHEFRLSTWIVIAREEASDIFEATPNLETIPAVQIDKMMDSQQFTSQTYTIHMMDFLKRLKSGTTAPVAPLISVTESDGSKNISLSGTAVFHEDKLVGELNEMETRGLMWVEGKVKSGIIVVDAPGDQGKAELEIFQNMSTVTPVIKDGILSFKIEIKEKSNLGSQTADTNLATTKKLEALAKTQNEAIKEEIEAALEKAQQLNADIFGFGEAVYKEYPDQWQEIKDQWSEIFPTLEVDIKVQSEIYGTGNITKPVM